MQKMSLTKKLLVSYIFLVLAMTVLMGIFILPSQFIHRRKELENHIAWTAKILSENTAIRQETMDGSLSQKTIHYLDELTASSGNIDYIVIAGKDSIRLFHPDHSMIGKHFTGDDQAAILSKDLPYITTKQGNREIQKRAFSAIKNDSGSIIGFVMVSASMQTIQTEQWNTARTFLVLFIIVTLIGIFLSWLSSRSIQKTLLGFDPQTFAKMYLQRDEILDTLNEEILAIDREGKILYKNHSAKHHFHSDIFPKQFPLLLEIQNCLEQGVTYHDLFVELSSRTLLVTLIPIQNLDRIDGVLMIIRDRTEATHLAEQLTGTTHIIDALRANTHEFMNKLHIISGLLQIGETEQAISFVAETSNDIEQNYQTVVRQIQNRTIAALIIGKQSHAKELAIQFILRRDSFLPSSSPFLSTKELITIVGNLVENAFEAVQNKPTLRQVELYIFSDEKGMTITVDDTGKGMTKEQIQKILTTQYTTKGDGHGYGLRLIQEIVRNHHGFFDIESEPGEGSSFTIILDKR